MVQPIINAWQKLTEVGSLAAVRRKWTPDRCRLVWVNGCWDLLHAGHVAFLRRARSHGDVLVVGVNDDASVATLKGHGRPVVSLRDRIDLLCELECVDYVVPFADSTPSAAVAAIKPDVVVKGDEYGPMGSCKCPEAEIVREYGGRVEYVAKSRGVSTSELVRRIQAMQTGGSR